MLVTLILFVVMLLVLVIPHEAGHMIVAKLCGVKVNEFSVGMGPLLYQKQKGETLYSVRLLPLGGYCQMEGDDEESNDPRAFNNKKPMQKIAILIAGVVTNIVLAVIIVTIVFTIQGCPSNTIGEVTKDSPAYVAGLEVGDKILVVNSEKVHNWAETVENISSCKEGDSIEIIVKHDGSNKTLVVKPQMNEDRMVIGIVSMISHNPLDCMGYGVRYTWELFKQLIQAFKQLFTGNISKQDIAGPVGIVKVVDQTRQYGFTSYMLLLAIVSLNLAIFNLLPFPSLDGGRIVFVIIRAITGKAITDEMEAKVHAAGMVLLFLLLIFVTFNDITNLFK